MVWLNISTLSLGLPLLLLLLPLSPLPAPQPQTSSSLMVIDRPRDGSIISRAMKSARPNVPDTLGAVRLPVRAAASSPLGPRHTGFRGQSAACLSDRRLLSCLVPGTLVLPFFLLSFSGSFVLSFLLLSSSGSLVLPFFLLSCPVPDVLSCPSSSCLVPDVLSCPSSSSLVQFWRSCLALLPLVLSSSGRLAWPRPVSSCAIPLQQQAVVIRTGC